MVCGNEHTLFTLKGDNDGAFLTGLLGFKEASLGSMAWHEVTQPSPARLGSCCMALCLGNSQGYSWITLSQVIC